MRIAAILFLFVITVTQLQAQEFDPVTFSAVNGPSGGTVEKIEFNAATSTYFAITGYDIYKSSNSGTSWTRMTNIPNSESAWYHDIFVDASGKIYITTHDRLWKSTDNGESWVETIASGDYNSPRQLLKNESTGSLFVIGYNEPLQTYDLSRSIDDGQTWEFIYSSSGGDQVNDYTIKNTVSPGTIFLVPNNVGVVKSTDDGTSWSPITNGLPGGGGMEIEVSPVTGYVYYIVNANPGAYVTTDDGANWQQMNGSSIDWSDPNGLHFLRTSRTTNDVFIAKNGKIHRTAGVPASASDWTEFTPSFSSVQDLVAVGGTYLLSLYEQGIRKSTNSGSAWSVSDAGINRFVRGQLLVINDVALMATGSEAIRRTSDFGESWNATLPCDCQFSALVKMSDGDILAIGSHTARSSNSGINFSGESVNPEFFNHVFYQGDDNLYALAGRKGNHRIYHTADEGANWTNLGITGLSGNTQFTRLRVLDNGDIVLIGMNENFQELEIVHIPHGTTAANVRTVTGITNVRSADAYGDNIFVFGDGAGGPRMATSSDGGLTWTLSPSISLHDLHVINDDLLFGRGPQSFQYSHDGGATWKDTDIPDYTWTYHYLEDVGVTPDGHAMLALTQSPFYVSSGPVVLPREPQNLRVVGLGANRVEFRWDYEVNPVYANFYLERRKTGDAVFETASHLTGNSARFVSDLDTEPETSYEYRLVAANPAGKRYSNVVVVTTSKICEATIPDNRSWTAVNDVYSNPNVLIQKISDDTYQISDVTGGYTDGNVTGPKTAYFTQNCDGPFMFPGSDLFPAGNGSWDGAGELVLQWEFDPLANSPTPPQTVTFTLNDTDPSPETPQQFVAYAISDTEVRLEWNPGDYNASFTIERDVAASFDNPLIIASNLPTETRAFTDNSGLSPGNTYHYRIKAANVNDPVEESGYVTTSLTFKKPMFVLSDTEVSGTPDNAATFAWGDMDDDGDDDLFVTGFSFSLGLTPATHFFENTGDGNFIKHTDKFEPWNGVSPSLGDYNNDGQIDVLFSTFLKDGPRLLYKNNGDLSFQRINMPLLEPEVDGLSPNAWVDVDGDGNLDVFMIGGPHRLLLNDGNGGFTLAPSAGNALLESTVDFSDFIWADYDNDSDPDVLIITDENTPSLLLFQNDGNGNFTQASVSSFTSETGRFASGAWGDFDNDQDLDLFLTRESGNSVLFRNDGANVFTKLPSGISGTPTESGSAFGAAWGDINNDGNLDLIVARPGEKNSIYLNNGSGTSWTKVEHEVLTGTISFNSTVALSDYDQDGRLDVMAGRFVFAGENAPPAPPLPMTLFRNNTESPGNWLLVKLRGTESNRQAIGAQVRITAGGKTFLREVNSHSTILAQNSQILHFGLASATSITSLQVQWPSGLVQHFPVPAINQLITLVEDGVGPQLMTRVPADAAVGISTNTDLSFTIDENATPKPGKKVGLFLSSDMVTPVLSVDITAAQVTGMTYLFVVPGKLQPNTSYTVKVEGGALVDIYGNENTELLWSFTTSHAPLRTVLAPVHTATNVNASTNLSITFNKAVTGVSGKLIYLYETADLATPIQFFNADAAAMNSNTATFVLSEKLKRLTSYTVVVEPGAFEDIQENEFAGIGEGQWTFTTDPGPSLITFSPANNATDVSGQTSLQLNFNENVLAVTGKKIEVFKSTDMINPVFSLNATTGALSGSQVTFSFPAALDPITVYHVSIEPGAFTDVNGNNYGGLTSNLWKFTTASGPIISSLAPAHNATNVNVNTSLTVSFNKSVTGVTGKYVRIYRATDLANPVLTLETTDGDFSGNSVTFTPTTVLDRAGVYHVGIDAGAFVDADGNASASLPNTNWIFYTDSGPTVVTLSPAHQQIDVNAFTTLTMTFNRVVTTVGGKKIRVFAAPDFTNAVETIDAANGNNMNGTTVVYSLSQTLDPLTEYHISVDEGALVDLNQNSFEGVASGQWTFTTKSGPVITARTPQHNASGINANTQIVITFDRPSVPVAGKKVRLYTTGDITNPVEEFDAITGVSAGTTVTFTPSQPLSQQTDYRITIDPGAFTDAESNKFAGVLAGEWSFTTDPGPAITATTPVHLATNVQVDQALHIVFDRFVTAVAGANIHVQDGSTTILSQDITTGTVTNTTYQLTAPLSGWPTGTTLTVTIDPGAFHDENFNYFTGLTSGWEFTTAMPDNDPPQLTLTNTLPETLEKGFSSFQIVADVRDDSPVQVTLNVRSISGTTFFQVPGIPDAQPFKHTFTLQEGAHFDAMGAEFYIEAKDGSNNVSRIPDAGHYVIRLKHTSEIEMTAFLGFGGSIQNWKVFSVPFELNSISDAFGELDDLTPQKDFRILTIANPDRDKWTDFPSFQNFNRGQGYFVNIRNHTTIQLPAGLESPDNHSGNLFNLTLESGWNMVGNPYLTLINWDDVVHRNPGLTETATTLLQYNNGSYSANPRLDPYGGGFVFNSSAPIEVVVPLAVFSGGGGRKQFNALGDDLSAPQWKLDLEVSQDGISNRVGAIGMSPAAKEGIDNFDVVRPPRLSHYLDLSFNKRVDDRNPLTRDIVPSQSSYTWDFQVGSNLDGRAELRWDAMAIRKSGRDMYLLDISRQTLINMGETGTYLFTPKESVNFKIYFGEGINVSPERVSLGRAYPNPTNGETKIAFTLSDSGGLSQNVSLELIDPMGRPAGTIARGRFNPGYHEVTFDASEMGNGLYIYRMTVEGTHGTTTVASKLFIK